jgi:hypothetical protein
MSSFLDFVEGFLHASGYHRDKGDACCHIVYHEDVPFEEVKEVKRMFKRMMVIFLKTIIFEQRYEAAKYVAVNCTCIEEAHRIIDKYIRQGDDEFPFIF